MHLKSLRQTIAMLVEILLHKEFHQRKKSNTLLKIGKTKVCIPFRELKENFTNLLPQMSKDIQSNFNKRYERRQDRNNDTTRRSDRHNNTTISSRQHPIDVNINLNNSNSENKFRDIHLVDYSRCYVEDYMLVEVGEIVLILVPLCYIDDDNSWSEILLSDIPKQEILSPNRLFLD